MEDVFTLAPAAPATQPAWNKVTNASSSSPAIFNLISVGKTYAYCLYELNTWRGFARSNLSRRLKGLIVYHNIYKAMPLKENVLFFS